MYRIKLAFILFFKVALLSASSTDSINQHFWLTEVNMHYGNIVENSSNVPQSRNPYLFELNTSVQTNGNSEWHHIFGFPKVGGSLFLGKLGNPRQLGNIIGLVPKITFNSVSRKWYSPEITLGMGLAYFNKPFHEINNPDNVYIGSNITFLAHASVLIHPVTLEHFRLNVGVAVIHCSNSHYQVPNLGINLPSIFLGIQYRPKKLPSHFERKNITVPPGKLRLNIRGGAGVHVYAGTLGPTGTAKYAIYITDLYVSRRFGKVSNIHAGLEIKHYNSYYNYIMEKNYYATDQKLKSTVFTPFLAHELMIRKFSFITQGGINVYNKFYTDRIYERGMGFKAFVEKIISTKLGFQYYFLDPRYCTRTNFFIGLYIKAHFGRADFTCAQVGFVF